MLSINEISKAPTRFDWLTVIFERLTEDYNDLYIKLEGLFPEISLHHILLKQNDRIQLRQTGVNISIESHKIVFNFQGKYFADPAIDQDMLTHLRLKVNEIRKVIGSSFFYFSRIDLCRDYVGMTLEDFQFPKKIDEYYPFFEHDKPERLYYLRDKLTYTKTLATYEIISDTLEFQLYRKDQELNSNKKDSDIQQLKRDYYEVYNPEKLPWTRFEVRIKSNDSCALALALFQNERIRYQEFCLNVLSEKFQRKTIRIINPSVNKTSRWLICPYYSALTNRDRKIKWSDISGTPKKDLKFTDSKKSLNRTVSQLTHLTLVDNQDIEEVKKLLDESYALRKDKKIKSALEKFEETKRCFTKKAA